MSGIDDLTVSVTQVLRHQPFVHDIKVMLGIFEQGWDQGRTITRDNAKHARKSIARRITDAAGTYPKHFPQCALANKP
jgi:thiamine kinase-like enzyme